MNYLIFGFKLKGEARGQRVTLDLFQALLSSPLLRLRVSLSDRDVLAR